MAKYSVDQIRNIVFCGHGSAGKTTLVDKILTTTGAVNRNASVDDGPASATSTRRRSITSTRSRRAWCIAITAASTST